MEILITEIGIDEVTKSLMKLPSVFAKARISALKSTGWFVQRELRNHIEYGGSSDWPALHPLTMGFKKKRITAKAGPGSWTKRRSRPTALFWLGKFARYRVDPTGDAVKIGFGKSKKSQLGRMDTELAGIVERAEYGERVRVTGAMRGLMAGTRRKRPKNQIPGETYFPLKKSTHTLTIPKRPIFAPVWKKVKVTAITRFRQKFWKALDRKMKKI